MAAAAARDDRRQALGVLVLALGVGVGAVGDEVRQARGERPRLAMAIGNAAPLEGWFREDLAGVYRDVVLAPDSRLRDHLDQEVAAGMLTEHLGGRADLSRRMWLLLAFELWARRWVEVGVRA